MCYITKNGCKNLFFTWLFGWSGIMKFTEKSISLIWVKTEFCCVANFNSSLNFLAIFIDFNNSLRRVSQVSKISIEIWAETWSERHFKLSMTTAVKDQLLDQKI